jgi:hypothetical protein
LVAAWGSHGKTAAAYMLIAPSLAREPEHRRWIIEPDDDGLEIPPWPRRSSVLSMITACS